MKKLILAAVLAGSMVVMAEEKSSAAPAAPVAAETARRARPQLTEEQKAQMKARREKFMAERKARQAEMQAKMLETIKKYVPDEAKAKELQAELEKNMMSMRRPMGAGRPQMKRAPKAPATVK